MNHNIYIYIAVYLFSVMVSAVSQILLKKSAMKPHKSWVFEYLNVLVITAYFLFFASTLLTMFALKVVPLSAAGIIEATGYIFVMVLGAFFLKEKISRKKLLGASLIIIGAVVYALPLGWYVF